MCGTISPELYSFSKNFKAVYGMRDEIMKKEAAQCGAPYEKKGRVLVWHDEFDKGMIDPDKWGFSRTMFTEGHEYDNSEKHGRVENGQMHLQVHKSEKEGFNWSLSQGFNTLETMAFRYGYVEMRANIPFRHGAWPSFWCTANPWLRKSEWGCEIDIFEIFSSDRNVVANLHKWGGGKHCMLPGGEGSISRAYTFENYENLNNEYHLYAMEWDKDFMKFYVDDNLYCTVPISGEKANFGADIIDGIDGFHDPERLIINNEIFSEFSKWKPEGWALTEEDEKDMPIDYWIDYVRLYQDPATEDLYLKEDIAKAKAAKEAENK